MKELILFLNRPIKVFIRINFLRYVMACIILSKKKIVSERKRNLMLKNGNYILLINKKDKNCLAIMNIFYKKYRKKLEERRLLNGC
jgi:hypothetical protein